MERGWRGSRRVCLVARIRGRRQQQIWFIMASLTVSLSLLVSSFLSSLSLFQQLPPSSSLTSPLSISMDLLNGPVWLIWVLTAGIRKGYYRNGCSFLRPSWARQDKFHTTSVYAATATRAHFEFISSWSNGNHTLRVLTVGACCFLHVRINMCLFTWPCLTCTNVNGQYWLTVTWSTLGCEIPGGKLQCCGAEIWGKTGQGM